MKCSVYIATSADGYIATPDGAIDWLYTAGNPEADLEDNPDMGFGAFLSSVDCMIMGRKCMESIASMNLTPEQWPYGGLHIVVLSHTLKQPPENLRDKVTMFSGEIPDLIQNLESKGFKHAYVDGGATITSFINLKLIDEMTITAVPILLGKGRSLFGQLNNRVTLDKAEATVFANHFIQVKYKTKY